MELDPIATGLCVSGSNETTQLRGVSAEVVIDCLMTSLRHEGKTVVLEAILGYFLESGQWIHEPMGPNWVLQATIGRWASEYVKRYPPSFWLDDTFM